MKESLKSLKIYFNDYLLDYKKEITTTFIFVILSIAINAALPMMISVFIDSISVGDKTADFFSNLAFVYLIMLIVKIVLEMVNSYICERLGWTISNKLRVKLVKHCVDLDFDFHKSHKAGEMIERVDGDVSFLSNFFSMFLVNIIGNSLFIILVISIFYIKNGFIGLGYSIVAILAYFVFFSLHDKIVKLWSSYRENETTTLGFIKESISLREDLVGVGEKAYFKRILSNCFAKTKRSFRKASVVSNVPTSGFFGLMNIGDFLSISIGTYLLYKGEMTIGSIYLISNYIGLLNRPFIALRYELDNFQKIGAALKRITELLNIKQNISSGENILDDKTISIKVQNLSFAYDQSLVLKDISFETKALEVIGIVGRTGSGKTTLIKLLSKMYDVKRKSIFFNGKDIEDLNIDKFYDQVYVASQNSRIFNASIFDNITSFDNSIKYDEVMESIRKVGLLDWVNGLSDGLDTVINPSMLSAGQAQLLFLARAFMTDAKLYIFDEINSKLDSKTEDKIYHAIENLIAEKTAFIIVQKLKLLGLVDKVMIIENGCMKMFDKRESISDDIIKMNLEG